MKRILLMVLRNIVFVPYWWIKLCWYAAHTDDYPEEKKYAFLRQVDERAIEGGNIHIDVHGAENIPKEKGFMFFPNHQGLFDVLAIIRACSGSFFGSCKEGSWRDSFSEAGFCLYESLYH